MIGIKAGALLAIAGLLVAACDEEETAEPVETIKAIKRMLLLNLPVAPAEPTRGPSRRQIPPP